MKPHNYTSEGIVLARKNYGEADRIISVYTKNYGRLSLIAKGIRKPRSKKRGHLEVFSRIKFQANVGKGLDLMTEVEIIDNFEKVRKDLRKVVLAYYFCEAIGKITHEGESNNSLYDLLKGSLFVLQTTTHLKAFRINFLNDLLVISGYWPKDRYLANPDEKFEEVVEKQIVSARVGKRMIQ